jgi:hypothetical protein
MGEMMLRDRPQWVRYEMDQLRERVSSLSRKFPPRVVE